MKVTRGRGRIIKFPTKQKGRKDSGRNGIGMRESFCGFAS